MKKELAVAAAVLAAAPSHAAIVTRYVDYRAGDAQLRGYLAYDDAAKGKRPGILVVHEWWGLTDHPKRSAEKLAQLGYVAFALDMYGTDKATTDPAEAGRMAGAVRGNPAIVKERFAAAQAVLRSDPRVNGKRIAAIGYCFGGTIVLENARMGADLRAVVSFHGGLASSVPKKDRHVKTRVLVCHGAADPAVPPAQVAAFEAEMKASGARWKLIAYPDAVHAFTNPAANSPTARYNEAAATKSWEDMKEWLAAALK